MDNGLLTQDKTRLVPGVGRMPIPAYSGHEPYIFLSYAHKDSARVIQEIDRLNKLGFHVWYDEGIAPGNEWTDEIAEALEKSSLFLVMMTPNAAQSDNVQNEINYAVDEKKPFLAVHLEETELRGGVRLQISTKRAILKYKMSEEEYVFKLVKALEQLGLKRTGGNGFRDSGAFKKDAAGSAGNRKTIIAIASAALLCVMIGLSFGLSGKPAATGTTANTETAASTGTTAGTATTASETPGTYAAETQPDQDSGSSQRDEPEQTLPQSTESARTAESQSQSEAKRGSEEIQIFQKDDLNYEYYIEEDHVIIKGILREGSAAAETVVYPEEIEDLPVTAIRHDEADDLDLYYTEIKDVILPETLVEIGAYSFLDFSSMKEINIPEGVVRIEDCAFASCRSLEEIILPESVQSIGWGVFMLCESLKEITLPESVRSIGWGVFRECKGLKQVSLPEQITKIPEDTFYGCESLESAVLPDKVILIEDSAFLDCENLTRVTFPSALEKISSSAFTGCRKLSEIILPATVSDIGINAFAYCYSLRTVRYQGTEAEFHKINTYGDDIYKVVFPHAQVYFEQ